MAGARDSEAEGRCGLVVGQVGDGDNIELAEADEELAQLSSS